MADTVPRKQHEDLQQKYDALYEDYTTALVSLDRTRKKLRLARDSVKSWQKWIDAHPKYVRPAANELAVLPPTRLSPLISPGPTNIPAEGAPAEVDVALVTAQSEHVVAAQDHSQAGRAEAISAEPPIRPENTSTTRSVSLHRFSSRSTQIESDDLVTQHSEMNRMESDDEPVVVSTRAVRKPGRRDPTKLAGAHDGTPSNPFRIKREEPDATQPICDIPAFLPTQASDLDRLVANIETPRKRQKLMDAAEADVARTIRASKVDSLNKLLHTGSDENTPPPTSQTSRGLHGADQSSIKSSGRALQSLSTNTPTLPRTGDVRAKPEKSRKSESEERLAHRVANVAEDSTDYLSADQQSRKKARRLEELLQGDGAHSTVVTPQATRGSRSPIPPRQSASPATVTRPKQDRRLTAESKSPITPGPLPNRRERPVSTFKAPKRRLIEESPPSTPRPEEEPLRARPLHRLTPGDFRINPLFAGTDFAFNAPLRDHASRQCVPGCTKPCCTALQHFADIDSPRGRSRTRQTDEEDEALLRDHLGHDPSTLTSSQRESLLRSAHAQKVANKYGKHRQVFERRQSPPGFWDTEMPSTQDRVEQKEQVKEREKLEVEQRWREAVRGDGRGRWIFSDELPKTR